jgi:hypothetical protein
MPWDWPWSSARAHSLEGTSDLVLDSNRGAHLKSWDYDGWKQGLLLGVSQAECDAVRRATHTGEPLGSREFLRQLERHAGRRLKVLARGRPAKRPPERNGVQQELFSAES